MVLSLDCIKESEKFVGIGVDVCVQMKGLRK
jgi:hypothetical protein